MLTVLLLRIQYQCVVAELIHFLSPSSTNPVFRIYQILDELQSEQSYRWTAVFELLTDALLV